MPNTGEQSIVRAVISALPVIVLGVFVSLLLSSLIQARVDEGQQRVFERDADEAIGSITREIERHAGAFDDVVLFAAATWPGDIDEWQRYVGGRLDVDSLPAFSSGAAAFEIVPANEIESFVERENETSGEPFSIIELTPKPPDADRLVLTRLQETVVGGVALRGLEVTALGDVLDISLPEGRSELTIVSIENAPATVTNLLGIEQAAIEDDDITGTDAIFIREVRLTDDSLVGWVFAPVQLGNLLTSAVDGTSASINISVRAMEFDQARDVGTYIGSADLPIGEAPYAAERTQEFAGLTWQIAVWADSDFESVATAVRGIHALGAGLLLTAAFAGLVIIRRQNRWKLMAAELEASLQRTLAETDALTGLLNRQGLQARFSDARLHEMGAAAFFVDVDDFKLVNDEFGHSAGDTALIAIADGIRSSARGDDLVARIGGDEFLVICPGLIESDGVDRISSQISASIADITDPCAVSGSVGVAVAPPGSDCDLDDLLERADSQMYVAKNATDRAVNH